jgi:hypothetical protein
MAIADKQRAVQTNRLSIRIIQTQMSFMSQADGMWWNLNGPVRPFPSLIEVMSDFDVIGPRR